MAEQERKVILKVETGDSQRTVKSLKQEISDLKDSILNLEKGSDDYNDAVKQLTAAQRDLNEVQALTKRTATALDGSYDALVHKMSQLKKEWRATADVAKRAEIGEEIGKINAELKELDAEIGNYQRNVGNYVSHWEGMPEITKDFGTSMREMSEQLEPTKMKFESVANIASGVAGGFAAVQGAMALLGVENENLEQTFVKLQAAMAIAQGVGGLSGLVEGVGKAKVAFEGLGTKIKAVTKTMGTTGWIAVIMLVITAIAGLVSWIKKTKDNSEELEKSLEKLSEKHKQIGSNVGNTVGQFKLLEREFKSLKTNADKQKWIDDNTQAFSSLGLAITNVNDANKIFLENSDKIIEALKLQAEAAALNSIYQQAYGEAYAKKRDIDARKLLYTEGYNPTDEEKKGAGLGLGDWQTQTTIQTSNYGSTGAAYTTSTPYVNAEGAKKLAEYADTQKEIIDAETNAILEEFVALQAKAKKAVEELGGMVTNGNGNSGNTGTTLENLLEQAQKDMEPVVIEDVPIEIEPSTVTFQEEGEYLEKAKISMAAIEKTYNDIAEEAERERTTNEIKRRDKKLARLSEEEALEIKAEERKLEKLKELEKQAKEAGDGTSQLILAQQIADQEVAIVDAKNKKIIQSEQQRKEKTQKILGDVSSAIAAAGSVTQGILEITQAAAEKDDKITEKEAKKIKGLQIALATMNMLAGITAAISGAFTTKTGPWDIALAAVQAASIAAAGTANIMKIKNTDLTGSVPSGAQAAVTPNSNIYGTDLPFSYTRNVTTSSEVDELNKDTRVYILESDIQESNSRVQIRESESSF